MNNEIKEILDDLKKTADNTIFVVAVNQEELDRIPKYTANFLSINNRQAKILLDYITNLRERNEKAIEFVEQNLEGIGYVEVCDLLNILQGDDKDD